VLAKDALEPEAQAVGGAAGALVASVCLPLEAPVAQVVEGVAGQQVDRLGGRGCALEGRAEPDVADLDYTVLRGDPQVARDPARLVRPRIDDREEERVRGFGRGSQPGLELAFVEERPVGQEVPQPRVCAGALRGGEQRRRMPGRVEWFQPNSRADDRLTPGPPGCCPAECGR
jgi:hypothetical protein